MAKPIVTPDVKAALYAALVLIALGLAVGNAALGFVIVPLVYFCVLFAATRLPLRYPLFTLMFLALTLENPAEQPSCNLWESPLYPVGALLLNHMNVFSGFKPLFFSGMDVCLITLLLIGLSRRNSRSSIDAPGRHDAPPQLVKLALLSFAGTGFVLLSGLARGGDFGMSLWQIDRVVYLPLVFILFCWGLRGPRDHETLAKIVLAAAIFRAVAAALIIRFIKMPNPWNPEGDRLPHATSHHDSILFACAFALIFAIVLERVGKNYIKRALIILPILAIGIVANGRRMAWVHVGLTFIAIYFMTPDNAAKRTLRRAIVYSTPLVLAYIAVGWNSGSSLFKPVRALKTVTDSSADSSTMWRELENFNLILTLRTSPLFGVGYGNGYQEIVTMPPIDYSLERYVPHNSVLGLWAYAGPIGFSAMTLLWTVGVYFAVRGYHAAKQPSERAAALVAACTVLIYLIQCWGDMGLGTWTGVFTMAPALAVAGKLAVATGGWPSKRGPLGSTPSAQASVGQRQGA